MTTLTTLTIIPLTTHVILRNNVPNCQTALERLKQQTGNNYMELLDRDFFEFGSTDYGKTGIKIMQYNVTLDTNIGKQSGKNDEKSDEKQAEMSGDNWQYRGFRIIEIISKYEPEIITIQELNHFKFMCHYLEPLGYAGVFKLNTKSKLLEGTAVFYLEKDFEKITTFMYGKDVEKGTKFDLFALTLVLKPKKSDTTIVVSGVNLDCKDKTVSRINKLDHLTNSLKEISAQYGDAPIFIGCDLGADQSSDEYCSVQFGRMFLKDGKNVPKGYEEGYGINLCSAYYPSFYKGKAKKNEPKSTMFGGKCRDYIFFDQEKGVTCSNVLTMPIDSEISQFKAYPNFQSPSKHFPLMAQFFV